jgi:hypothetical protein
VLVRPVRFTSIVIIRGRGAGCASAGERRRTRAVRAWSTEALRDNTSLPEIWVKRHSDGPRADSRRKLLQGGRGACRAHNTAETNAPRVGSAGTSLSLNLGATHSERLATLLRSFISALALDRGRRAQRLLRVEACVRRKSALLTAAGEVGLLRGSPVIGRHA